MTFDELFQYYADYGFTKPTSPVGTAQGITSLPQVQEEALIETPIISQQNERNKTISIPTYDIDYTQVPSLFSQYMRPTSLFEGIGAVVSPIGYLARKGFDYARDQSLAQDVQEMGQDYDPYGLGDSGVDYGRAGGGGFGGGTAGGFSESDPTATEGSFARGGIVSLYGKRT